jgi:hypothetical protein
MSSITLSRKGGINVSFVSTLCWFQPLRFKGLLLSESEFQVMLILPLLPSIQQTKAPLADLLTIYNNIVALLPCAPRNYRELAVAFLHVNGVLQEKKMCLLLGNYAQFPHGQIKWK